MRNILVTVLALVFLGTVAYGGVWNFVKAFPDTNLKAQVHGITVDKAGKVWIQRYSVQTGDSVFDGGKNRGVRKILVLNPDGTPSSLSSFWSITVNGVTDTMFNSQLGMRTDPDGNVILCTFDAMYRVNYQTGAGMNKVQPVVGLGLTAPAVDAAGDIFTTTVLPGYPLRIFDAGFNDNGVAIDTVRDTYGRSLNVSADGATIYLTRYSSPYMLVYHSANGTFGPYEKSDSTLIGMAIESSAWNPRTGLLYVSSGGQSASLPPYGQLMWYGFDASNFSTPVDSIVWNQVLSPGDCRPRAIAFSPGGDTAYVGEFGTNGVPAVQMFVWAAQGSVKPIDNTIPASYDLSQNYPNPFNPTTNIDFSIPSGGNTTLKVYDVLGKEVATLVNERLSPGKYSVSLDATRLASGTYIYSLISGTSRITKKMMLLK